MIRKFFCYLSFILEFILVIYIIYGLSTNIINSFFIACLIASIFNIILVLYSILLFGAPNNSPKEYLINHINYLDILQDNKSIILNYNEEGLWEFKHKDKTYVFNLKGWPNLKKRISDIIFIQFHNNYCTVKSVINSKYSKNYFKKYKIKIIFCKNNKVKIKKFKPSFILKLKMIISVSQWKYQSYHGNEVWKRDIWDTFRIIRYYKKKEK